MIQNLAKVEIQKTKTWIEKVVIGLGLCPFAKMPFERGQIRYVLHQGDKEEDLAHCLLEELSFLNTVSKKEIETTLIIHPNVLQDFTSYNSFLAEADWILQKTDLEGIIQIASFHPNYQFAGTRFEDASNYTNRSPYPMLHLLREESIELALENFPNPEQIPERNIKLMEKLGTLEIKKLLI